jgi:hypothetical protein
VKLWFWLLDYWQATVWQVEGLGRRRFAGTDVQADRGRAAGRALPHPRDAGGRRAVLRHLG